MTEPRRVTVEWTDAKGPLDYWRHKGEVCRFKPSIIVTRGFLVKERKRSIIIASSWDKSDDNYGGVVIIPRANITKWSK